MIVRPSGKTLMLGVTFAGLALLLLFVTGFLTFTADLTPVAKATTPASAAATKARSSAQAKSQTTTLPTVVKAPIVSSLVDFTQDVKAMGYPDGRKLVRDQAGQLYVAYRKKYKQDQLTAYHIFVAKSIDNGVTWQVVNQGKPIEQVGDYNQRVPAIAIDSQQNLHVVWYGKDAQHNGSEENQIKYARSSDGGASWSTWQNIAPISGYSGQPLWQEHPTIYLDRADTLYVVWEGRDNYYAATSQIKLVKSVDGGHHWSTWINVAPTFSHRSRPALVTTPEGTLYLLAYGHAGSRQQILYTYSTDEGKQWQRWSQLAPSRQDQRHLSVDVDSQGQLHVVWRQVPDRLFGPTTARIHYAHFDGQRWSLPLLVAADGSGAQTFPSIGIDRDDAIWITWSSIQVPYAFPNDAPEQGTVYYIVKTAAGWSDYFFLGSGGRDLYSSLNRRTGLNSGAMGIIWLANQGEQKQIHFAALPLPTHFNTALPVVQAGFFALAGLDFSSVQATFAQQLFRLTTRLSLFWQGPLARELITLLLIVVILSIYVTAKFLLTRHWAIHRQPAADH